MLAAERNNLSRTSGRGRFDGVSVAAKGSRSEGRAAFRFIRKVVGILKGPRYLLGNYFLPPQMSRMKGEAR